MWFCQGSGVGPDLLPCTFAEMKMFDSDPDVDLEETEENKTHDLNTSLEISPFKCLTGA